MSTTGWSALHAVSRGGPELGPEDACPTCLAAQLDSITTGEETQVSVCVCGGGGGVLGVGGLGVGGWGRGVKEDVCVRRVRRHRKGRQTTTVLLAL